MHKSAAYRLGEKAADYRDWPKQLWSGTKKTINAITPAPVKELWKDTKDTFNAIQAPSPEEVALRKRRNAEMKKLFGKDTLITGGGHLRGAGYAERVPFLKLKNVEDIVTR